MGVRDSIRAYNGVITWLNGFDLGKPKKKSYRARDEYLNNIFIKFGKEHNIEMENNNSRGYKGSYNPMMSNCCNIQNNWQLFKDWIIKNYPKTNQ